MFSDLQVMCLGMCNAILGMETCWQVEHLLVSHAEVSEDRSVGKVDGGGGGGFRYSGGGGRWWRVV